MENKEQTQTENLILEILECSKESIKGKLKKEIEKQLIQQMSYSLRESVSEMASKFVKEEMEAEILEMLKAAKPEILEQIRLGCVKIGAQLTEAMVIQATKNLQVGSYGIREMIKKLFD